MRHQPRANTLARLEDLFFILTTGGTINEALARTGYKQAGTARKAAYRAGMTQLAHLIYKAS